MNKPSLAAVVGSAVMAMAMGCSSVPDEPRSKEGFSPSTGSSTNGSLTGGSLTPSAPANAAAISSHADPANTLRAAAELIDADDQLPLTDPVFTVLGGATYTGDVSVVLTQASASGVSLLPSQSGSRPLAQEDSVEFVVRVASGGKQLSFSIPLKEDQSQALFSKGQLTLGESSLASLLGYDGQQVFRVLKLTYKRWPNGIDQVTASFAPFEDGAANVPGQMTFTGAVRLLCLPAAPAGQLPVLLDDPMLRSPFCQAKIKPFALQVLAP